MLKKQVTSIGVALAMSYTSILPALAQGDPVPGPPPAPTPSPTPVQAQTQQPSALQTLFQNIQQQQQIQNIFNPSQFPAFIQANPSISPLDQRSGLSNNANSVNKSNSPQTSLGITQGTPTIGGNNLLSNPWLVQKNMGSEIANRFGGPAASSLFEALFLATNGQPGGLMPSQLDRVPTITLYGALLGLAKANNLPISDSLLSLMEMLRNNPSTFDLLRPTLLQLANGIISGTMSRQTLLNALSFLTNPQTINGFVAGVQSANAAGRGASQTELNKQIADAVKQVSLGLTPNFKPVTTSPASIFFGSSSISSISQNVALNNAMAVFTNTLSAAMRSGVVPNTPNTSNTTQTQNASSPTTSVVVLDPSKVPTSLNTPLNTNATNTTSSAQSEKPTESASVGTTSTPTTTTTTTTTTTSSTTSTSRNRPVPTVTIAPAPTTTATPTQTPTQTTPTGFTINTTTLTSLGGIGGTVNVQGLDLETAMMLIQSQRAGLVDANLTAQMQAVSARNQQMVKLNEKIADVTKQWTDARSGTDDKKTEQLKTELDQLKAELNQLGNTQQMDMLKMQSLTNKRNQAFELMTNFIKKMQDSRSAILGNMR